MMWDSDILIFGISAGVGISGVVLWFGYSLTQLNSPMIHREGNNKEEEVYIAYPDKKAA